jgi:hypothetical protein
MNAFVPRRAKSLETLESRRLLAAFETPWPEPRELTISFPADGAWIGSYASDLRSTFDQVAQRQQWEELALRAFQTWAIHADINVGLRNDHNIAFGTPGLTAGDPRFGDFRIGSFPQVGLLANSVPFQAVAGTYSGDVLLNSSVQYRYHDWVDGQPPAPGALLPDEFDLFSVLLHEAGNALGLDDRLEMETVMFGQYTVPKGILSADDIAAIQALYGARTDPYELFDNGQLQMATLLPAPSGFDPDTGVIGYRGSLVQGSDVDLYELIPVAGRDTVTIRLKAAGISLLKSRLEILDSTGTAIGAAQSVSVFDNDNLVEVSGLQAHAAVYVRVSALDAQDVYALGDYRLEVDYRSATAQAAAGAFANYDAGPDALFAGFGLIDGESGENDTVSTADALVAAAYHPGTRYEHTSSVSAGADIDAWKITAPAQIHGRLIISLAAIGLSAPQLRIQVVDAAGVPVGAAGWLRPDGTWALEVGQPQANQDYWISISVDPNSAVSVGNYVVTAEFATPAPQMNDFVESDLAFTEDLFLRWTAGKTKLFRFDLGAIGGSPGDFVKLTIYDAHTQEMRLVIETPSNITRTALVWLNQGEYILRFSAQSDGDGQVPSIHFFLTGDGVSDDQDDYDLNPEEGQGDYDPYYHEYEYDADLANYYEYESSYGYSYDYDDNYEYEYSYPS